MRLKQRDEFFAKIDQAVASKQRLDIAVPVLVQRTRYVEPQAPTAHEQALITAFHEAFPHLAPEFRSFQEKPAGCGCTGKIQVAFGQQAALAQVVLDRLYGAQTTRLLAQHMGPGVMVGHTEVIDATAEAWTRCFQRLAQTKASGQMETLRRQYTGVHVRDVEGGAKWLLLFY
jgi:hypothetical protein